MSVIKLGFRLIEAPLADVQAQVEPGWAGIIERLVHDLFQMGWNGEVLQVKEKFGGLRFYTTTTSDLMDARIDQAATESYRTCEFCGKPGVPRSGGWIKTLCDEHAGGREPHEHFVSKT
jgi:hypothetical protein